jgi:putative SOS response-associated peptidase YedK
MCGRTVFSLSRTRVAKVAGVKPDSVPSKVSECKSFNLGPSRELVCVSAKGQQDREVKLMRWGIDPRFETDKHLNTINARIESVDTSRMYSALVESNRCVVIVDGFYEWTQTEKIHKPHLIRFRDDVPETSIPGGEADASASEEVEEEPDCFLPPGVSPLLLAGICDKSRTTGEMKCSIVTIDSAGCVAKVHSRMPVLLSPETAKMWLRETPFAEIRGRVSKDAKDLSASLQCVEVSTLVNSVAHQSREVTLPLLEAKKRSFQQGLGRYLTAASNFKKQKSEGHRGLADKS